MILESIKSRRIVHTKWFKLIFIRSLLVFNIFCFCNNLSGSNEFITESVHRLTKWYNDKNAELAFFKFLIGFSSPVCKTRNNIIGFIHLLSIGLGYALDSLFTLSFIQSSLCILNLYLLKFFERFDTLWYDFV